MRGILERASIFSIIVLPTVYLVSSAYPIARVLVLLLEIYTIMLYGCNKPTLTFLKLPLLTYLVAVLLIMHMLLVDLVINDYSQGVGDFIVRLITISILPTLALFGGTFKNTYRTIMLFGLIPLAFGIVQTINPYFTIQSIWPNNPVIFPYVMQNITAAEYIAKSSRVVGTENIAIGFAFLLGTLICISLVMFKGFFRVVFSLILAYVMYNTQTRSAAYGIIVVVLYFVYDQVKGRKFGSAVFVLLIALSGYFIMNSFTPNTEEQRLVNPLDNNTYGKIISAYIGVTSTLKTSPIFGIPREQLQQQIMDAYATIDYSFLDQNLSVDAMITNHNQFVWYLRYYGMIGAVGIIALHVCIWKLIGLKRGKENILLRMVFINTVLFSLMHNTNIVTLPILWFMISGRDAFQKPNIIQSTPASTRRCC